MPCAYPKLSTVCITVLMCDMQSTNQRSQARPLPAVEVCSTSTALLMIRPSPCLVGVVRHWLAPAPASWWVLHTSGVLRVPAREANQGPPGAPGRLRHTSGASG